MANVETKFNIGDTVYQAFLTTETKRFPCPDCKEEKHWSVKSPGGQEYTFPCPRCSASYGPRDELRLDYAQYSGSTRMLTIGSVRVDTADKERPVSYMCKETGVGSGSVYYEGDLFASREEAIAAAGLKADEANKNAGWVKESYDKALNISDYKLDAATLQVEKQKVASQVAVLRWFVEDVRTAASLEEIEKLVEKFDKLEEAA